MQRKMQRMQRMSYTPEQKAEALRLLAEVGKAEAARRTGIPAGTIAAWGSRTGVAAPMPEALRPQHEARHAALLDRRVDIATRKAALAETLLDHAVRIAGQLEQPAVEKVVKVVGFGSGVSGTEVVEVSYERPPTADQKRIAETVGVLVAQVQLLTGEATSRVESSLTVEGAKQQALGVVDELAARRAS